MNQGVEFPTLFSPAPRGDLPVPSSASCPACGAPTDVDDHFCPACGRPLAAASPTPPDREAIRHFRCQSCGAEIQAEMDQRSYTCPFCDSNYVAEFVSEASRRQPPEFVIGFSVTREEALGKFHAWLRDNSWIRPGDLRSARIEHKLRGVYVPFWTFTMLARSKWSASIGEHWYRTETYTTIENGKPVTHTRQVQETEWWDLAGRHHRYYYGYLVSGSKGLPQSYAQRIQPFRLEAMKRYEPYYLAGWLAEEYTVERDAALQACMSEFRAREQRNIAAFLPGDTHRNLKTMTEFDHINSDLVLLPVHLLSYRYRNKVYRFLVNGQTGVVSGDKPVAWRRILAVLCALAALAVLLLLLARGWQ